MGLENKIISKAWPVGRSCVVGFSFLLLEFSTAHALLQSFGGALVGGSFCTGHAFVQHFATKSEAVSSGFTAFLYGLGSSLGVTNIGSCTLALRSRFNGDCCRDHCGLDW